MIITPHVNVLLEQDLRHIKHIVFLLINMIITEWPSGKGILTLKGHFRQGDGISRGTKIPNTTEKRSRESNLESFEGQTEWNIFEVSCLWVTKGTVFEINTLNKGQCTQNRVRVSQQRSLPLGENCTNSPGLGVERVEFEFCKHTNFKHWTVLSSS